MQNSALTCVTTIKFLGVNIDHKFKWNDHITYIKVKFISPLAFYTKLTFIRHEHININVSFICFLYLIYCVEIWGNASAIHLDPLKKRLKKCSGNNIFRILDTFRTTLLKN